MLQRSSEHQRLWYSPATSRAVGMPMSMTMPMRPMSLSQLLDRSFFLYRRHFSLFVGITALPQMAVLGVQLLMAIVSPLPRRPVATIEWLFVVFAVSLAAGAISQGATVIAVSAVHLGENASVSGVFARIRSRFLSLVFIASVVGVMVGIGFVCLIVPGVLLGLMWSLTIPVAVLENSGLGRSLSRSYELTRGSWGRIFLICVLTACLMYAVYFVVQGPIFYAIRVSALARHGAGGIPLWTQVALPIGGFLSRCLVGSLMTTVISLIYY